MRTWITLLALAVVGATAPAAPYGLQHMSGTLALFCAAAAGVLGTCVLTGWLISEGRFSRGAMAALFSRFAAHAGGHGSRPAERLPQSGSFPQAPARTGSTHISQLGEPGESVLLRARTSRHGDPIALREPAGLPGGRPAEEPMMQRR